MSKTLFVLLLPLVPIFAGPLFAQTADNVTVKVTVVNRSLELKNVPKFGLVVRGTDDNASGDHKISTDVSGKATLTLSPGRYIVSSASPLVFEDKSYTWTQQFDVTLGSDITLELSSDNAVISSPTTASGAVPQRRRVSEAGELFKTLRDGVVTIEGELGSATGFIVDDKGLVVTNQHVIAESNEIRVRFDKQTAVKARVLAVDEERDLAVLQINLSAFPKSQVLRIGIAGPDGPSVVEGEQVFSIGSPLRQDKILTTGIVSKIDDKAIISDIAFSYGSAGSPLFNSVGEVVGITAFNLKDKDGGSLAGIIRIDQCADLLAKAREAAVNKNLPSAELMPNMPDGTFPVETIKTAISSKDFPVKQYISDIHNYEVKYMTPIFKFYTIEKDRIDSIKIREKRNKEKGGSADMFRDLRSYSEYAGELVPVVDILALPEITATPKSLALSVATGMTIGYSTPYALKYKADFYSMRLTCDGKEVAPLRRTKTEIDRPLQNYYKSRTRYTYAGVYSYPYELFAPGRCGELKLQIFSEEDIEEPITTIVSDTVKNRVWSDFQDFRSQAQQNTVKP